MATRPVLKDSVEVTVSGQPGASKKQLYFLALSAAFSVAKRFDLVSRVNGRYASPPPGMLMIEYDAADNWVKCVIEYEVSTAELGLTRLVGITTQRNIYDAAVYKGPDCDVVGERFSFVGGTDTDPEGVGIPKSSVDPNAPILPFAGRTILTPCPRVMDPDPSRPLPPGGIGGIIAGLIDPSRIIPSPNPKPPGDNRSRGSVTRPRNEAFGDAYLGNGDCCLTSQELIPLVFTALSNPGSYDQEIFPPPVTGPKGG